VTYFASGKGFDSLNFTNLKGCDNFQMASIEIVRQIWADVLGIETGKFVDSDNFMTCR
jgi:hypothetical protein